jgi:putative phosphoribosyl transferase
MPEDAMSEDMTFYDRYDAGRKLADRLMRYEPERPVVLGLARGGVVVAAEIARAFQTPLDVMVARKLAAPQQPEFGFGAIAPGGVRVVDDYWAGRLGLSEVDVDAIAARELAEIDRRLQEYRGGRPELDVEGRVVILADDGLATGVTAKAAVRSLRSHNPKRVVLAVPVCSDTGYDALSQEADEVVCIVCPPDFRAVGMWYVDFSQTTDEEVVNLLEQNRQRIGGQML